MDYNALPKTEKKFTAGEIIFNEGDIANYLYIIISGEAEVFKTLDEKEIILADLKKDDFFGEMALFIDDKRSATIRAKTDLTSIIIDKDEFLSQLNEIPEWFGNMIKVMAKRLKDVDEKVVYQSTTGIEFTILNLVKLTSVQYGIHTGNLVTLDKEFLRNKIKNITGMNVFEIEKIFCKFTNSNIIIYESETNKLVIQDNLKLDKFIEYYQYVMDSEGEENRYSFPNFTDEENSEFMEQFKSIKK